MKTYYFNHSLGYIGGVGVVKAESRTEALDLANGAIEKERTYTLNATPKVEDKDLFEIKGKGATVLSNGDY